MNNTERERREGHRSASIILSPSEYWLWVKLPTEMEFQAIEQLDNGQTDILYSQSGIELGVLGVAVEAVVEVVCLSQRSKIQMLDIFLKYIPCLLI